MKYMKWMTLLTFGLVLVSCTSSPGNLGNGGGTGPGPDVTTAGTGKANEMSANDRQAMLNTINGLRKGGHTCPTPGGSKAMPAVPAFAWNDKLELAALRHTNVMLVKSPEFDKVNPHSGLGDGNPGTRATATGYKWLAIGENIAGGAPDVSEVIKDWLKSPDGHCEAIMDKDFTQIGAAKLEGGAYGRYWTLNFGKPQ